MAKIKFEDGTVINFEGDPTSQDIEEAYSQVKKTQLKTTIPPELNILGNIYTRPAAAIRSALMGKGYTAGALEPTKVPSFQEEILKAYYQKLPQFPGKTLTGNIPSAIGLGADILTNPADILTMMVSGKAIQLASKTKIGQAMGRFFTKPRGIVKLFGKRTAQNIAEKVARGEVKVAEQISNKYDTLFKQIGKGETYVDDIINSIDDTITKFPEGANVSKLNKIADRLMKIKEASKKINAQELQNLKQEIRLVVPKSVIKGQTRMNAIQRSQTNIYHTINDALERIGGKQYTGLSKEYREWMNTVDEVNSLILQRGKVTDIRLGGRLSTPQKEALEKLSSQLPPQEQFLHQFEAWRRGQAIKKGIKRIAPWLPILGGGGYMGWRWLQQGEGGE